MAIAGKVAITLSNENGGAWSADVTYDRLVAVKHNNNLYISRKTVANVEPPNNEFWFLALEGFGGEDVEEILQSISDIIDGTTQVGNSKTLDGHGAEYFLPKSGGEINGDVTVKKESGQVAFSFKNGNREMVIVVTESGTCGVLDQTNKVWLWNSELNGTTKFYGTASGNLPLTGGRLSKNKIVALEIENTSGNASVIDFYGADGRMGALGFNGKNIPIYQPSEGGANTLLHTGNKPNGTYTGNGDATVRTINTGGIGNSLVINGLYTTVWVGNNGAIGIYQDSTSIGFLNKSEIFFKDGVLTISTGKGLVNTSGQAFTYQVL